MKYIISLLLITFFATALNAQNVGIGTTTPVAPLHVVTAATVNTILESSSDVGTSLKLKNTSTGGDAWNLISTGQHSTTGTGKLTYRVT